MKCQSSSFSSLYWNLKSLITSSDSTELNLRKISHWHQFVPVFETTATHNNNFDLWIMIKNWFVTSEQTVPQNSVETCQFHDKGKILRLGLKFHGPQKNWGLIITYRYYFAFVVQNYSCLCSVSDFTGLSPSLGSKQCENSPLSSSVLPLYINWIHLFSTYVWIFYILDYANCCMRNLSHVGTEICDHVVHCNFMQYGLSLLFDAMCIFICKQFYSSKTTNVLSVPHFMLVLHECIVSTKLTVTECI